MGNYWIDLNSRVPDEDETVKARMEDMLQTRGNTDLFNEKFKLYKDYPDNKMAKRIFTDALYELAASIIRYSNSLKTIDFEDALQEAVTVGWEKVDRCNIDKCGKAFNYFTTCMMGHLRQVYRTQRHYNELVGVAS